jgi:AmmeMemoRadiSam system protein B
MDLRVRPPAVAGTFYPADPGALRAMVEGFLEEAGVAGGHEAADTLKAVIAPHAGYVYSGPVAATAYAHVAEAAGRIRQVVLLGPAHRYVFWGLAAPDADAFATPLGRVPLDHEGIEAACRLRSVSWLPEAHEGEHSLEVHLPFLQVVLEDFTLVPLVVGEAPPDDVAEVLDAVWGGPETLIVVSSDLSHYLGYAAARELDEATARAVEALDPEAIARDQACGRAPVAGLLQVARDRGLRARTLDLRSSGDTAGDERRVVGYGAWALG